MILILCRLQVLDFAEYCVTFFCMLQDVFRLMTPGGGGYGNPNVATSFEEGTDQKQLPTFVERGSVYEYHRAQESV
jgi:N-methylhydantoinase B/oxoprolinase/acetone carboxylase alpha subunit